MIFLFFTVAGKKVVYFPAWNEAAKKYVSDRFTKGAVITRLTPSDILYWKKDGATYSSLVAEQLKVCKKHTQPTELAVRVCYRP